MTHRNAPAQGAADPSVPLGVLARVPGAERARDSPLRRAGGAGRRRRPTSRPARRRAWWRSTTPPSRGGSTSSTRLDQAYAPKAVNAGLADRQRGGRLRRRVRRRRGQDRRELHARRIEFSQPMEPHACMVVPERRGADRLRQLADRRRGPHRDRQHAPDRPGADPHRDPLRRRRVRLQAGHPLRDDPGGARRA